MKKIEKVVFDNNDDNTGDEGVTYYKELEDTEEEIESEILDQ